MKKLSLALTLMFLSMGAAYAQQAAPSRSPLAPGELDAVALYGRAQAFHDIVQAQHCEQINAHAVDAVNLRFENARAQLAARFGERAVPASHPVPTQIAGQPCDPMTIESYSNHVRELEQQLSGSRGQAAQGSSSPEASASSPVDDAAQEKLLQQAMEQINAGMNDDAIHGPLAQVIHAYETAYGQSKKKIYCAESMTETLFYLGMASSNHQDAEVLKPNWALAYYLRGYAYGAIGDATRAEASLKQALALSPSNSQYLSELGNVYENQKDWPNAMKIFQSADDAAAFAPSDQKITLRCRALRGQGYVLVELHKLDEATKKYNDCLSINPGDRTSIRELGYVQGLQAKSSK